MASENKFSLDEVEGLSRKVLKTFDLLFVEKQLPERSITDVFQFHVYLVR